MPDGRIGLVVADDGQGGYFAAAPRLPGYIATGESVREVRVEFAALLREDGMDPIFQLAAESTYDTPEGQEFAVRYQLGERAMDRARVAQLVTHVMSGGSELRHEIVRSVELDSAGQLLLVCADPSDTLGDVMQIVEPDRWFELVAVDRTGDIIGITVKDGSASATPVLEPDEVARRRFDASTSVAELFGQHEIELAKRFKAEPLVYAGA